ncbi:MAG: hypothetical protein HY369_04265 [Candidatus Aenigmarchaeota archaeon]|nr:hypothetical protein [Candidatus Aenigmarchaeota archaeon]
MDKLLLILFNLAFFALMLIVGSLAGATLGGLAGWIVGWTPFGDWILHVLRCGRIDGFTMAELGALMGFAGGFLRAASSKRD